MSLISDALKTAQRQRASRDTPSREVPILAGFFPAPARSSSSGDRWRGAMIGGSIGLLLLAGFITVREWKAMHPSAPAAKIGLLPLPRITEPAIQQGADTVAQTRADTAGAKQAGPAAQQGEQVPSTKPKPATPAPVVVAQQPAASASRAANASAVAPAPHDTAAAPTGVSTGGLHVAVQGGAKDTADRLLQQARDAQRQGDIDAAEDVYRRAVATHQADAEIYNNYAALLADRGDSARAVSMYKLAITLEPSYVDAWSNLGTLYDAMGDHRLATGVFQQVLKLDRNNVAALNGLAEQYQALGDLSNAQKLFEQVTRTAPDYARAHYELAVLLDGQSDPAGAIREYGLFLQTANGRYPQMYEDRVRARIAALGKAKKP